MEYRTICKAMEFSRITIFSLYMQFVITIFSGYLQVRNRFIIASAVSIPMNICAIIGIYISNLYKNVYLVVLGMLLGNIISAMMLVFASVRCGYFFSLKYRIKDSGVIKLLKISVPIILGLAVNSVNTLIDRILASGIVVGGISTLTYGNQIAVFTQNIFVSTLTTVLFPDFAKLKLNNDLDRIKTIMVQALEFAIIFLVPIIIGGIILAKPIIKMLYGRGEFGAEAIQLTAYSFSGYLLGVLAFGFREIMTKVFYAFQETRTVMANSMIGIVCNIFLNIWLSKIWGIFGLALASSISSIIIAFLLLFSFVRRYGSVNLKKMIQTFSLSSFSGSIMGMACVLLKDNFFKEMKTELMIFALVCLGAMIYFAIMLLLNKEMRKHILKPSCQKMSQKK